MQNLFHNPTFVRVGFNPFIEMFYLEVVGPDRHVSLTVGGDAAVPVALLKANGVRHFDYADDLAMATEPLMAFIAAAKTAGFEV